MPIHQVQVRGCLPALVFLGLGALALGAALTLGAVAWAAIAALAAVALVVRTIVRVLGGKAGPPRPRPARARDQVVDVEVPPAPSAGEPPAAHPPDRSNEEGPGLGSGPDPGSDRTST